MNDQDILARRALTLKLFREFDPEGLTAEHLYVVRKLAHYAEIGLDHIGEAAGPESAERFAILAEEASSIHSRVCGEQERIGGVL